MILELLYYCVSNCNLCLLQTILTKYCAVIADLQGSRKQQNNLICRVDSIAKNLPIDNSQTSEHKTRNSKAQFLCSFLRHLMPLHPLSNFYPLKNRNEHPNVFKLFWQKLTTFPKTLCRTDMTPGRGMIAPEKKRIALHIIRISYKRFCW